MMRLALLIIYTAIIALNLTLPDIGCAESRADGAAQNSRSWLRPWRRARRYS